MRDVPDARALLEIALQTLRDEILPGLPAEKRYAGLMIANALSIAARELAGLEQSARAVLAALSRFYDEDLPAGLSGQPLFERLDAFERRFCQDIASGKFDASGAALLACLEAMTRARLAISNPKAPSNTKRR